MMIRILINGAFGRMGQEVCRQAKSSDRFEIAARVDAAGGEEGVLRDISEYSGQADCIIDFSHHLATRSLLEYAVRKQIPAVIATTGHTDQELQMIKEAAEKVPVFHSSNMSLGVALLVELAVKTASVMPEADIEIVETHHNRKLDAPSGTALMLAEALKNVRKNAFLKPGRLGKGLREKEEIGIHAIRRGNIVGIHEVIVSTDSQTITLKHEAHTRALFAEGALCAAEFLCQQKPGLYDMKKMICSGEAKK